MPFQSCLFFKVSAPHTLKKHELLHGLHLLEVSINLLTWQHRQLLRIFVQSLLKRRRQELDNPL